MALKVMIHFLNTWNVICILSTGNNVWLSLSTTRAIACRGLQLGYLNFTIIKSSLGQELSSEIYELINDKVN